MRCLGRTETDRKITNEPWSSKQNLTEQIRPLFGVNGVVRPKNKRKMKKGGRKTQKDLTEPTLLEMPVYPGALRVADNTRRNYLEPAVVSAMRMLRHWGESFFQQLVSPLIQRLTMPKHSPLERIRCHAQN